MSLHDVVFHYSVNFGSAGFYKITIRSTHQPVKERWMSDKVLVCDDEPYILESVAYIIEREGFEVLTAEDGEEALDVAKKENPKLIFLDVMMPKKTGYEVCEELKSNPDTKDIHIIMLTARGQDSDEQMAKDVGANEYMTKPFSPRKLRKRLRSLLG